MSDNIINDLSAILQKHGGGRVATKERFNEFFKKELEELQEYDKDSARIIEEIEELKQYPTKEYIHSNIDLFDELAESERCIKRIQKRIYEAESLLNFLGVQLI